MGFQFDVAPSAPDPERTPQSTSELPDLLRQILEVQREQLSQLRAFVAAHDGSARWKAFLARWREDFPDLSDGCRLAMPILERTYSKLISELTEYLAQNGSEALDNDFALQEFLDRYGMRLTQLGTILNMVGPFAEAGSPKESA